MLKRLSMIALLLSGIFLSVNATSGIAVSLHYVSDAQQFRPANRGEYPAGIITRYNIVNDQVVSQKALDTTHSGGRWATLNISGTKCAYFKCTINSASDTIDKWYVSVVDIDGKNMINLVDLTALNTDGWGYMDWPIGDWIYFTTGFSSDTYNDVSKTIRRVNVTTRAVEPVITLNYSPWIWNLSAKGDRMTVRVNDLNDNQPCGSQIIKLPFPPTSAGCTSAMGLDGGCTNSMSPSGNLISYTTDAGHSSFNIAKYGKSGNEDTANNMKIIGFPDYNSWCVNCASIVQTCNSGLTFQVGDGCDENRYSVNSDKWMCFHIGWVGTDAGGRFMQCGDNQVLVNWQDQKTIMISANPRHCGSSSGVTCTSPTASGSTSIRQEAGDFIVTAPDSEINTDLRQYLTEAPRSREFRPIHEASMAVRIVGNEAEFPFDNKQFHVIRLYSVSGALVASRTGSAAVEKISLCSLPKGAYRATIDQSSTQQTATVLNW